MEVGAVKQAFNNELILLKNNLNQAKIQVIHKLTRKAKQLTEKKAPDPLKEKWRRKAESAVKEVLILKKIKARDIGKFSITHKGKLQEYLNKPDVDHDKACARLLLHKALQEKYKLIRNRFSNIPIKDLFMSRQERIKLKKEEQQKKKEIRDKKKGKGKVVNAEGDWDVEDIEVSDAGKKIDGKNDSNDESLSENEEADELPNSDQSVVGSDQESIEERFKELDELSDSQIGDEVNDGSGSSDEMEADEGDNSEDEDASSKGTFVKLSSKNEKKSKTPKAKETAKQIEPSKPIKLNKPKPEKRQKDSHKNKNLNEKIMKKGFKKDSEDGPGFEKKIVDPFFITSTGENYMSIAEPRPPDEVKEEHKQGNRQLRRAVMFGHVPRPKPRKNFRQNDDSEKQNRFNSRSNDRERPNGFQHNDKKFGNKPDDNKHSRFDKNKGNVEDKPEKLHPSWEAKKKQSGILPFKGKKTVFDDS